MHNVRTPNLKRSVLTSNCHREFPSNAFIESAMDIDNTEEMEIFQWKSPPDTVQEAQRRLESITEILPGMAKPGNIMALLGKSTSGKGGIMRALRGDCSAAGSS